MISWIILVGLPLVYLVVAWILDFAQLAPARTEQFAVYILLIVGIVLPAMIPVLERSQIKSLRDNPDAVLVAGQVFQTFSLVRAAIVESVYLLGMIAYVMSGEILQMLWFYPIGIIWTMLFWPRQRGYRRLIEKLNMP